MKGLSTSLIALLAAAPFAAIAQDAIPTLDEIVVTANRTPSEVSRIGVSVDVIDSEDLAGTTTVAEGLDRLPGVSVIQQGPFGSTTNVRVRGADGRYLAVYVDGVRVDDPSNFTTQFDFGSLMSVDVGRIELLRGSQSALWGGSAVGGVINISSRRAIEDGVNQEVRVEAGSYGTKSLSYGLTAKQGALETTLNLARISTDGYSTVSTGTEADSADANRLSATARYAVNDSLTLGLSAFGQNTTQEYDGFSSTPPYGPADAENSQDRKERGGRVFAEFATGGTTHFFDITRYDIDRTYIQEGSEPSGYNGNRTAASWTATTKVGDAFSFVYGADTSREEALVLSAAELDPFTFEAINTATTEDSRISGVFAQVLWAPTADLDISATLRRDDHSEFGGFNTGRLAAAWRLSSDTTIRASLSNGFRAPSLNELYADYTAFGYLNNPDLTPETSRSAELGIEHVYANDAKVSATLFRLETDDLIANGDCLLPVVDMGGYVYCPLQQLENLDGKSYRQGLELAASLPVTETVSADLSYTYTDTSDPEGDRLSRIPEHDLSIGLEAQLSDRLSGGLTLTHLGGRYDASVGDMEDVTLAGLSVSYGLTDTADAFLRIDNVADVDWEPAPGYNAAGRTISVGLAARF